MTIDTDADSFFQRLTEFAPGRHLVAVAGPPASGKSTLAEAAADQLNAGQPGRAAVVPMDGFHYDDRVLDARGHRSRKGAPHTFDVDGLAHLLGRLRRNDAAEVAIPLFDRTIETSRAGAAIIDQSVDILLVEGNYLLLRTSPWDQLHRFFDLTVIVDVPEDELRRRLEARWQGFGYDPQAAALKLAENDLPNGQTVIRDSIAPDMRIVWQSP